MSNLYVSLSSRKHKIYVLQNIQSVLSHTTKTLVFKLQKIQFMCRAGKVTFKIYFTTDYKIHAVKCNH